MGLGPSEARSEGIIQGLLNDITVIQPEYYLPPPDPPIAIPQDFCPKCRQQFRDPDGHVSVKALVGAQAGDISGQINCDLVQWEIRGIKTVHYVSLKLSTCPLYANWGRCKLYVTRAFICSTNHNHGDLLRGDNITIPLPYCLAPNNHNSLKSTTNEKGRGRKHLKRKGLGWRQPTDGKTFRRIPRTGRVFHV